MGEDHQLRPRVCQHLGGDLAGEGARGLDVAVLPADLDGRALQRLDHRRDQGRRRTDRHPVRTGLAGQGPRHRHRLLQRGGEPVHLPITGDQLARIRHGLCIGQRSRAAKISLAAAWRMGAWLAPVATPPLYGAPGGRAAAGSLPT